LIVATTLVSFTGSLFAFAPAETTSVVIAAPRAGKVNVVWLSDDEKFPDGLSLEARAIVTGSALVFVNTNV
jgi:hypothetical protein